MTPESQRIAIAEACGWRRTMYQSPSQNPAGVPFWVLNGKFVQSSDLPDYLNDLNAMHEAENVITDWWAYSDHLNEITDSSCFHYQQGLIQATATQRAEAFLRTLGLWKD